MPTDSEAGNHIAEIYAKIEDCLGYSDLDERVVELATRKFGDLDKNIVVTPQNLLLFEIIGESCETEDFNKYKKGGHLFEYLRLFDLVSRAYGRPENLVPIPEFLNFVKEKKPEAEFERLNLLAGNVKLGLAHGLLYEDVDIGYAIRTRLETPLPQLIGYGFYIGVWNNSIPEFTRADMEAMMGRITGVIDEKYPEFVEILQEKSK